METLYLTAEEFVRLLIQTDSVNSLCFAPVAAREALSKACSMRSQAEVRWLQQFVRTHRFLSQLPPRLLELACKSMRYADGLALIQQCPWCCVVEATH